jgi:hypothetical protein
MQAAPLSEALFQAAADAVDDVLGRGGVNPRSGWWIELGPGFEGLVRPRKGYEEGLHLVRDLSDLAALIGGGAEARRPIAVLHVTLAMAPAIEEVVEEVCDW